MFGDKVVLSVDVSYIAIFELFMKYLQFKPIYQERVWGGRDIEHILGREIPEAKKIGESWEIVDRKDENSEISNGEFQGTLLGQVRKDSAEALMGPGWPADKPFPILVKWLDCQERLSLQVHPPAEVAPELGGEPKTENWYILRAARGAALLAGLKPGVTRESFEAALRDNELEGLVCRLPSREGDSLFVPSGRIHAIDAGNLILEIQQNSDTTYRVYDWGRVGLDGQPRQLHVEESLKSIDFEDFEPELQHPEEKESLLVDSTEFRLRRLELEPDEVLGFGAREEPRILSVTDGQLLNEEDGAIMEKGSNLLLPYCAASRWKAVSRTVVLVTDRFNRMTE